MSEKNKAILLKGNAAIAEGNYEGFLVHCAHDTQWTFVGETTLRGIEAVRRWMVTTYVEPPIVTVTALISEGNFLTVTGEVTMKDKSGKATRYAYCDVWRFDNEKIVELKAFVIKEQDVNP